MKYILILIFVFFVGLVVFSLMKIKRKEKKLPFGKNKYFFSEAEKKFYLILKQIADKNNLVIFSKIRLRDLFYTFGKNKLIYYNRINQKHIDFLFCENNNFSPVLGIELDDSSRDSEKRTRRDSFVNKVFASVNLPILRKRVMIDYNLYSLEQEILEKINPVK